MLKTWCDFHDAKNHFTILLKKRENLKKNLNHTSIEEIRKNEAEDIDWLEKSYELLTKYQINLPNERMTKTPEQFESQLQKDITLIQEKAKNNLVTLPDLFSLGFSINQKSALASEELEIVNKQELLLWWLADHISEYHHLNLIDFHFENTTKDFQFIKSKELGFITLKFITNEYNFHSFLNDITNSSYFLIIEKITLENNNFLNAENIPTTKKYINKIVSGYDQLTIVMKIRVMDFIL